MFYQAVLFFVGRVGVLEGRVPPPPGFFSLYFADKRALRFRDAQYSTG